MVNNDNDEYVFPSLWFRNKRGDIALPKIVCRKQPIPFQTHYRYTYRIRFNRVFHSKCMLITGSYNWNCFNYDYCCW